VKGDQILTVLVDPYVVSLPLVGEEEEVLHVSIRPEPAAAWLYELLRDGSAWSTMIVGMSADDYFVNRMADALVSNLLTAKEFTSAGQLLLEQATGRPWWQVMNILSLVRAAWHNVNGELTLRGVDPYRVSIGSWIDATYLLLQKLAAGDSKQSLDRVVEFVDEKPEGVDDDHDGEMTFEEFMSAASDVPDLTAR
jgi:hypothetical protein